MVNKKRAEDRLCIKVFEISNQSHLTNQFMFLEHGLASEKNSVQHEHGHHLLSTPLAPKKTQDGARELEMFQKLPK